MTNFSGAACAPAVEGGVIDTLRYLAEIAEGLSPHKGFSFLSSAVYNEHPN
jgi:hypothetical protein